MKPKGDMSTEGENPKRHPVSLRATAYHEAGHAVAYYCLRVQQHYPLPLMRRVTIVPSEDMLGHTAPFPTPSYDPDLYSSPSTALRAHAEIVVCFAGAIAERRHIGRRSTGAEIDHRLAIDLAEAVTGSPSETEALLKWLRERAANLINSRWRFVEAVAAALLEHRTLTGRQVRDVIQADVQAQIQPSLDQLDALTAKQAGRPVAGTEEGEP